MEDNGKYTANYEDSPDVLEAIFPKDKNIFNICGAGGYAEQIKEMLISLCWDKEKVRDVGRYWFYKGKNSIMTKYKK